MQRLWELQGYGSYGGYGSFKGYGNYGGLWKGCGSFGATEATETTGAIGSITVWGPEPVLSPIGRFLLHRLLSLQFYCVFDYFKAFVYINLDKESFSAIITAKHEKCKYICEFLD